MHINNYFNTTIWSEQKPDFVKSLTKATNKYIKSAKNVSEAKAHIKKFGDFGRSYHSTPIIDDNDFRDFRGYIGEKSWEYLDHQGFDMSKYNTITTYDSKHVKLGWFNIYETGINVAAHGIQILS